MDTLPELLARQIGLHKDMRMLILEGETVQDKIDQAHNDKNLPPYVLANYEAERRELASKILKLHNQLDSVETQIEALQNAQ